MRSRRITCIIYSRLFRKDYYTDCFFSFFSNCRFNFNSLLDFPLPVPLYSSRSESEEVPDVLDPLAPALLRRLAEGPGDQVALLVLGDEDGGKERPWQRH